MHQLRHHGHHLPGSPSPPLPRGRAGHSTRRATLPGDSSLSGSSLLPHRPSSPRGGGGGAGFATRPLTCPRRPPPPRHRRRPAPPRRGPPGQRAGPAPSRGAARPRPPPPPPHRAARSGGAALPPRGAGRRRRRPLSYRGAEGGAAAFPPHLREAKSGGTPRLVPSGRPPAARPSPSAPLRFAHLWPAAGPPWQAGRRYGRPGGGTAGPRGIRGLGSGPAASLRGPASAGGTLGRPSRHDRASGRGGGPGRPAAVSPFFWGGRASPLRAGQGRQGPGPGPAGEEGEAPGGVSAWGGRACGPAARAPCAVWESAGWDVRGWKRPTGVGRRSHPCVWHGWDLHGACGLFQRRLRGEEFKEEQGEGLQVWATRLAVPNWGLHPVQLSRGRGKKRRLDYVVSAPTQEDLS